MPNVDPYQPNSNNRTSRYQALAELTASIIQITVILTIPIGLLWTRYLEAISIRPAIVFSNYGSSYLLGTIMSEFVMAVVTIFFLLRIRSSIYMERFMLGNNQNSSGKSTPQTQIKAIDNVLTFENKISMATSWLYVFFISVLSTASAEIYLFSIPTSRDITLTNDSAIGLISVVIVIAITFSLIFIGSASLCRTAFLEWLFHRKTRETFWRYTTLWVGTIIPTVGNFGLAWSLTSTPVNYSDVAKPFGGAIGPLVLVILVLLGVIVGMALASKSDIRGS